MEMATTNSLWVEKYRPSVLENYIGNEPFFLTYGDGLSNIDIYFILPITTNNNNKYDSLKCLLRLLLFVPITTHNNKHSLFHCVIDHVLTSVLTCKCVMTV